jgi:hypothetical protein
MAKVEGTLGNGVSTQFDVSAGFNTSVVAVRIWDTTRDDMEVFAFRVQRRTPDDSSVRLIFDPAPALNQLKYVISDETEMPHY